MSLNGKGVLWMSHLIPARSVVVIAIVALGVTGCTGATASARPSALATIPRTEASPTPDAPAASLGEPPQATLAAEGSDPVTGALGSFTWGDGGSDSPWLPGAPIAVGSGEPLTVHLPAGVPVKDWKAVRVPAGSADGIRAVAIADDTTTPIAFRAPGPGTWSTQLVVTFGEGLGSATYYWAVTVR